MSEIRLTITFNGAFRVSTGHADGEADQVIDRTNPLPASSLKGVLREAARQVLPGRKIEGSWHDHQLVTEVFGDRGARPSPWHFSDAQLAGDDETRYQHRVRIKIDEDRKVEPGALVVGEELYADSASATIRLIRPLDADTLARHEALLHVAARLVDGLGSDRRRGLGWVSITTNTTEIATHVKVLEAIPQEAKP